MRVRSRRLFLSTLTLVMTGCGSQQLVTQLWPWKQDPPAIGSKLSQPFPRLPGAAPSAGRSDKANTADFDFDRREVESYVDRFQSDLRTFYGRALERSGRYVSFMEPILKEEGVPPELVYLPLIESGFQTGAVSRAGAVGPWQFMRQTGRRYGLRIDNYVDERRDPIKSTEAAARYLRDLYDMFNDWHLSLAAYNTGEGNIARILERRGADDYWDMRTRGFIVRETREYVPRFLAALQIARSPEAYGFSRPEDEPLTFDWVRVNRPLSLEKVAEICGTSGSEIRELNPALTRGVIPHNGYTVRIPKGMKRSFMEAAAKLPATERHAAKARSGGRCSGMQKDGTYCLRTGETAASVAQRYGISTQALLKANDIRNPQRMTVGQALVIPGRRPKSSDATGAAAPAPRVAAAKAAPKIERRPPITTIAKVPAVTDPPQRSARGRHQVRSGETAAEIAKHYGISLNDLLRANGVSDARRMQVGHMLVIPSSKGASAKATTSASAATHTVRAGDTLSSIARRYGISVDALCAANGIKHKRSIHPGQKLTIPKQLAAK